MYSTCIFCNQSLGSNEVLESFSVGRRLAYDPAGGRLWVVCRSCERWNLTPLDTRWEAIEDAERAFRSTKQRASTDNIALARLREGLELVRIGKPPKIEFAFWRYGDQFGARRRKYLLRGGALGTPLALYAGFTVFGLVSVAPGVGASVALSVGTLGSSLLHALAIRSSIRYRSTTKIVLHDEAGTPFHLTHDQATLAALVPSHDAMQWSLKIRHRDPAKVAASPEGDKFKPLSQTVMMPSTRLHGEAARRALAQLLPLINEGGAGKRRIRDAVGVVESETSADSLLHTAATLRQYTNAFPGENLILGMPPELRLAAEMALHSDDEQRAMEGELAELEARWREADAIASIADSILLPADIDARIDELRARGAVDSQLADK